MPTTDPPIGNTPGDGAKLIELTDMLCSAFDDFGLEELVAVTLGEGLYTVYVPRGLPTRQAAYRLLEGVEKKGRTETLLRGALDRRPGRPDLRPIIGKYYPQVLMPLAVTRAEVSDVVEGLEAVKRRSADPTVIAMVTESHAELERVNRELDLLARYKNLHDALHLVQLQHLRVVIGAVRRLHSDPAAGAELNAYVTQLRIHVMGARTAVEGLPEGTGRQLELEGVNLLESAVADLRTAVKDVDERIGAQAVTKLKRVLRVQPFRVNQLLTLTAQGLPLTQLISALEKIATPPGNGPQHNVSLDAAINSLRSLVPDLLGCVQEHRLWQEVENNLWLAQEDWQQGAPSDALGQFWIVWPSITERVAALSAAYPTADWAIELKKDADAFERWFPDPARLVDFAKAQAAFELFRNHALFRFYLVDMTLKAKCGTIATIGAPLDDLLRE